MLNVHLVCGLSHTLSRHMRHDSWVNLNGQTSSVRCHIVDLMHHMEQDGGCDDNWRVVGRSASVCVRVYLCQGYAAPLCIGVVSAVYLLCVCNVSAVHLLPIAASGAVFSCVCVLMCQCSHVSVFSCVRALLGDGVAHVLRSPHLPTEGGAPPPL